MNDAMPTDNPYLLLTPGPLSTTRTVKAAMLRDWCTWDDDYNHLVQDIRRKLVHLAGPDGDYTSVLMQGSGTFAVEACLGSALAPEHKLLILANGAYGRRMAVIADRLNLPHVVLDVGETSRLEAAAVEQALDADPAITHAAAVHCETTTGLLNPVHEIGKAVKKHGRLFIVDAMSSFGGIPMNLAEIGVDFLVSSANKCLQGVPGFGFIIARRSEMEKLEGRARSLSLDMHDQWREMEHKNGKWRFTSPTHTVRAFAQALVELDDEGGVPARHERYLQNQRLLVLGLRRLGFETLLPDEYHSPIITSFLYPRQPGFDFRRFYNLLKEQGFVIYPGKVTGADTFRIGDIGDVHRADVQRLLAAVEKAMYWK
ncbi:MAG: 2-aminoethylphosphonate--pyruvate transaminase [Pseudomonadota bacterium]